MTQTYFTSLSGMLAASYGLQNTAHNVANLQNPGYKRSEVYFSALGGTREQHFAAGVSVNGSHVNFTAGKYLETNNSSDLAIVGDGFFVIRLEDGSLAYGRNGQFYFQDDGLLVERGSKGIVQGYNARGQLVPINQQGPQKSWGKETQLIELKGELVCIPVDKDKLPGPDNNPGQSHFETIHFKIAKIFDAQGNEHQLDVELETVNDGISSAFENRKWHIKNIRCDSARANFDSFESIEFDSDFNGNPLIGNSNLHVTLNGSQQLTLNFGSRERGNDSCVHLNNKSASSTTTNIEVSAQDGYGSGNQTGFYFNNNGQIFYQYDNGQNIGGITLALATFKNPESCLQQGENTLFFAKTDKNRILGHANQHGLGRIEAGKLESANVDSTIEFANIVVLQRMFQACSQIMAIDKQLLEEIIKK